MISDVNWIIEARLSMKYRGKTHPVVHFCTEIEECIISFSRFYKKFNWNESFSPEAVESAEAWTTVQLFKLPSLNQAEILVRRLVFRQPQRPVRTKVSSLPAVTHLHPFTSSSPVIWPSPAPLRRNPASMPFPPRHQSAGLILNFRCMQNRNRR